MEIESEDKERQHYYQNEFFIENWELLDILINDLLIKYNPFYDYKLQWFINETENIIEKLGGK